ncbi:probable 2-oxoglutarate-dependent dioxygenase AOP1 [Fagus crenata]
MGSFSLPKLPIIDMSQENLMAGTSSWLSVCNDVVRALEEYGCFVAVYNKVSLDLHNSIFQALKDVFDLPTEVKMKNISDKPYFGYVGEQPGLAALRQGMGIDDANTLQGAQSFTNLMWPAGNDLFCETALSYSKLVSELEQLVKRMIFESYNVEKYYESHIESTTYLLGLNKYRGPKTNESSIGCNMHTDKSFITILHQNQVNGLEIQTKDGNWIGFEPQPSSFLVMAGDAFLAWSNGRIHPAMHRVVMSGSEPRYSLSLFAFNSGIIQIPEELVDDEHPQQFKSFDHLGLLRYFASEEAQKTKSSAKAYCGV